MPDNCRSQGFVCISVCGIKVLGIDVRMRENPGHWVGGTALSQRQMKVVGGRERISGIRKKSEESRKVKKKGSMHMSMEYLNLISCYRDSLLPPPFLFSKLIVILVMSCESPKYSDSVQESFSPFFSIFIQFLCAFITKTLFCLT